MTIFPPWSPLLIPDWSSFEGECIRTQIGDVDEEENHNIIDECTN
jgi:hypothetical protein